MDNWLKYNNDVINVSQCTSIRKRTAREHNDHGIQVEYILFGTTGDEIWWSFNTKQERDAVFDYINEKYVCPIDMTTVIEDSCATINNFEEI